MNNIDDQPTPHMDEIPGAYPESVAPTPSVGSRQSSQSTIRPAGQAQRQSSSLSTQLAAGRTPTLRQSSNLGQYSESAEEKETLGVVGVTGGIRSQQPTQLDQKENLAAQKEYFPLKEEEEAAEESHTENEESRYAPIRTATATERDNPRDLHLTASGREITEDDLFRALSRRRTSRSGRSYDADRVATQDPTDHEEQQEINRLMSRMFGKTRQANSEEEKTRHAGVIWKDLTVRGQGAGAALQPSTGDIIFGVPRFFQNLFRNGTKAALHKPPIRTLINNFSGCLKPGEMMLVLGRPGAGCSTFLKVIGNQRFGYESIDGDVTYGGTDSKTMGKRFGGEILYNPEDDLHYATLKVKATLNFALKTRTPGKASRNEGESRKSYVDEFLRVVSKLLWLEHTMDTKVGNEFIRGVSGGEKKRVSIAEAMITKASTQCWDNSTKGLDSSTALEYVSSLRVMTNMARMCTSVALYQAGESLYERFDKVLVIDQGECCYFGPSDDAARYFKSLGFVQPERWTTADFLTSVVDPHERHIKEGWENRIPRSSSQFNEMFRKSDVAKQNLREIEGFEEELEGIIQEREAAEGESTKTKNFTLPFHKQVVALTHRQFLVMVGDKQSLYGKWGGILFQALVVGSLFFNLPNTAIGVFPRGGVIFFMLLFNALLALAELTSVFDGRPVLLKHKSFRFYRPSAYALAQTMVDVPLVVVQVFIFDIVVYFMTNLSRTPSQFFISLLVLFLLTMTMYAFFRAIGSLLGSLDAATRVTGVAIQALVVYTGYLIPPSKMHPWFSWLRWINPVQYGFEALMANEFAGLAIECVPPFLVPLIPGAQTQYQSCTVQGSTPGSTIVEGSNYIQVAFEYSRSHLWRNVGFICAFFAFFVFLTAIGLEMQRPNSGGGAVTIYKRGQVPESFEKTIQQGKVNEDEESGPVKQSGTTTPSETEPHSPSAEKDSENNSGKADITKEVARNDAIFTWSDVNYTIPVKNGTRNLLQNVNGFVRPGKLTALMGASGAGKTTLLNVLAQRVNFGTITGDFLVDGRNLPQSFQRKTGYAEQQDIHEPTATVREALRFSAELRRGPDVPIEEKHAYCEIILDLLEMRDIAGAAIGVIGQGLNQEQRKRLTIGVELAAKPDLLLFLDEPTSGLDSGAAFNIVRFLRKLADAGQAILCTIHQPSSVLFENFDILLLLKSGGRVVYFGELGNDSRKLLDYLEKNGGKKCPPKTNPAEYMLDTIGAGDPDYKGPDWGDIWQESEENNLVSKEIEDLISKRKDNTDADKHHQDDSEFAMPMKAQLIAVIRRSFVSIWRSPEYIIGMFVLHIFTGLFNAFTFWDLGNSQIDMQSRLFSIFMTLTISPPLIQQLQPRYLHARNIFSSRESNSKIYSWFAFVWGIILSEIPYRLVAGTLYFFCWYFPPNFTRTTFSAGVMWMWIMMFEMYYLSFGQAIAAFAPNELLASLLVPVFFLFVVSFCGVVVPPATLPYFWRSWMYWLSPFHYLIEGMLTLVTHNVPVVCDVTELALFSAPPGQTCDSYAGSYAQQAGGYVTTQPDGQCGYCQFATGDAFSASFSVYWANEWRDFGIFWGFIIFNFAVVFFASWVYLQSGRKVKSLVNKAKHRKAKS